MPTHHHAILRYRPSLYSILLLALFGALWLAGGSVRSDALGQAVIRAVSFGALALLALGGERPSLGTARAVAFILQGGIALAAAQLVPLPPAMWQSLPGRELFVAAADIAGTGQPWRPLAIVPGAALNALASLIVPVAVLLLVVGLNQREREWLPTLMLAIVGASAAVGLLQFSGVFFNSPLINGTPGEISGSFSNRNHFALLLAFGCLLAPVWAFLGDGRIRRRGPIALGLTLLFLLMILGSGSRAGVLLGGLALVLGFVIVWHSMRKELRSAPRWVFPTMIVSIAAVFAIFVLISIASDRAAAIGRILTTEASQDLRSRGLPTVLSMIQAYFPAGSGLGGFDPIFRIHEPFELLQPPYFNHAHNDFLEIALDAGLAGMILLMVAIGWWAVTSFRAWRAGSRPRNMLPKLGSAMVLLVLVASVFDYPARVPMVMAWITVAAIWLSEAKSRPALPSVDQHI